MEAYIARLPRIVDHVSLMLQDRGYHALSVPRDIVLSALDRKTSIGETLSQRVLHRSKRSESLWVSFLDPIFDMAKGKEVMTSSFQIHGGLSDVRNGEHALIICFSKLSPDASREAIKLRKRCTVMTSAALAFPISKHVMIPPHTALSEEDARAWEVAHKVERSKLPVLRFNDPVRLWYGWPRGTLVQIDRGSAVAWRCVK